jgi:hypothetical protein
MNRNLLVAHRGYRALMLNLSMSANTRVRLLSAPRALMQVQPADQSLSAANEPVRKLLCQGLCGCRTVGGSDWTGLGAHLGFATGVGLLTCSSSAAGQSSSRR